MLAGSHVLFGTGSFLLVSPWVGFETQEAFVYLPVVILGALLPDLDARRSALKKWWLIRFLTMPFRWLGHRTWTHSLLILLILFTPLMYLEGSVCKALLALNLGYASHIVADWMTHRGVPLLYPLNLQFRAPMTFRTGAWIEKPIALLPFWVMAWLYLEYGVFQLPVAWLAS